MTAAPITGYAPVDGLRMYHEVHGTGQPLVMLHGAFSAIGTSFAQLIPGLAERRQVIGTDLQAHGRTADIDRPLRLERMADDVAGLLDHLGIEQADVLGYSNGASVALHLAVRHPERVRKLVLISVAVDRSGTYPGFWDSMGSMTPEMLHGSVFHDEYLEIAPRPEDFPVLFAKKQDMDRHAVDFDPDAIRAIRSPALIIQGDSDIFRPEHAVEVFRLFGGGVIGDVAGLPDSELAVIPGATHLTVVHHPEYLVPMIHAFLDRPFGAAAAPTPAAGS
jgi:pimeloyl-ACP methyl ester carboxylesterase